MSAGNGRESARVVLAGSPRPRTTADLSSAERSAQTDAIIAHLQDMTEAHNQLGRVVEAQGAQITALTDVTDKQLTREREYNALTGDHSSRIGAMEFDAMLLASSFMARLRRLVFGR